MFFFCSFLAGSGLEFRVFGSKLRFQRLSIPGLGTYKKSSNRAGAIWLGFRA